VLHYIYAGACLLAGINKKAPRRGSQGAYRFVNGLKD
jgi:hypothetical protein